MAYLLLSSESFNYVYKLYVYNIFNNYTYMSVSDYNYCINNSN